MKKTLVLLTLALFISCKLADNQNSDLWHQIKRYEYVRNSNLSDWQKLQKNLKNADQTYYFFDAIAKMQDSSFVDFLVSEFKRASDDSLRNLILFALGQSSSQSAERALLDLAKNPLTRSNQIQLIKSLSHCASSRSVRYLASIAGNDELRPFALRTLAICAKNRLFVNLHETGLLDTLASKNNSPDMALLLYYASSPADIPLLTKMLPSAREDAVKYLLKALDKFLRQDNQLTIVKRDSFLTTSLNSSVFNVLTGRMNWNTKLYALQVAASTGDSMLVSAIRPLLSSSIPYVKIAATRALISCDKEAGLSFLLAQLERQKDLYLKGHYIQLLVHEKPVLAYRFIMQNLDKGDSFFKESLLRALGRINKPYAEKTLRQFIPVQDSRLANAAFEILDRKNKIRAADADILLHRDNPSSVAIAVDWYMRHKKKLVASEITGIFKRFPGANGLETQLAALALADAMPPALSNDDLQVLWKNSAHTLVQEELLHAFPRYSELEVSPLSRLPLLPPYLQPDSLEFNGRRLSVSMKTNRGTIIIELNPRLAPLTVANFIRLAEKGFYNGLLFHRVVADFVIQGGDPLGDGWGGPGYLIPSENNRLPFERGTVGIATAGFDTGGSQFFICQSAQPHLDGNYTAFGRVVEGIEIVDLTVPGDQILEIKILSE